MKLRWEYIPSLDIILLMVQKVRRSPVDMVNILNELQG